MSIEASSFVLGLSMGRGNGIRKLILLGFANHADKHGRGAYPSTQTIADYAECDVRTVQRHVGWLIANGFLHEGDQRMVDHLDPRYRPIVYDVAMSHDHIHQWAAEAGPPSGNRTRSAEAGRRGGRASAQLSSGDNPSPQPETASQQAGRGDDVSPLGTGLRGDNSGVSGVPSHAPRGDSSVTRTAQEPSSEPSSSPPSPQRAPARRLAPAGGRSLDDPMAEVLHVLPEAVRNHPSVVPRALARLIRTLDQHGWPRAEIRNKLSGVETANQPGAAALTRLGALAKQNPPSPPLPRPRWCGQCDQRTRLREDQLRDDRPYRCPECHPQTTAPVNNRTTLGHAPHPLDTQAIDEQVGSTLQSG